VNQAEVASIRARLDRAHSMACSDPTDPTRKTHYSEARDAIDVLTERLAEIQAAASRWRATIPHSSGAFYAEGYAHDSGLDAGFETCADDIDDVLEGFFAKEIVL
jgi:hypothetical protein